MASSGVHSAQQLKCGVAGREMERVTYNAKCRMRLPALAVTPILFTDRQSEKAMDRKLFTPGTLADFLGISKPQLAKLRKLSRIPEPLYVGERQPRWRPEQIDEWLKDQDREPINAGS